MTRPSEPGTVAVAGLMFDFAALDVAIGLIFVYLVLSLACSALNETISSVFSWRAKFLREGIANLLDPENEARGRELMEELYRHPLVNALIRPVSRRGRARYPSYIPSQTFVAALLGLRGSARDLEKAIAEIPSAQVQEALTALLRNAGDDVQAFQRSAERWFDDAMERVSGWYRRRVQLMMWILAAGLVLALNVDTVRIAEQLWDDKSVRAAVIARAESATSQAQAPDVRRIAEDVSALEELEIPLGWTTEPRPSGIGDWLATIAAKTLGLLLTAAALTLGAPFWFDMLSKVARIRSAGAPPPASGAVRKGEGEQTRAGAHAEPDADKTPP
ncbi:MAG TPA: hypothetical protein VHF23_05620 [Gaiellaceae bacterium]|nr:hypothetical protein [Gaiellaceae bacterium]